MLVNKSSLSAIFTGLKTIFNNALTAQPGNWQATAMEVISTAAGEDYAWLSRFPKMRKERGLGGHNRSQAQRYRRRHSRYLQHPVANGGQRGRRAA
jgi:phage major head subunit gpT-like protein